MRTTLDHARFFIRFGFPVLPLHRPVERMGRRVCSCGSADCHSPAKHPAGASFRVASMMRAATSPRPSTGSRTTPGTSASRRGP